MKIIAPALAILLAASLPALAQSGAREQADADEPRRLDERKLRHEQVKREADQAARRAREQAEKGRRAAQAHAQSLYDRAVGLEGKGRTSEAIELYEQAAKYGSEPAADRLSEIYKGLKRVPRSQDRRIPVERGVAR